MANAELMEIGNRIFKKRKQMGLTQEALADKMNVSIQMISNLEHGNKAIKIENLIKISDILDVSTDYILKGTSEQREENDLSEKINLLTPDDYKMVQIIVEYCVNK